MALQQQQQQAQSKENKSRSINKVVTQPKANKQGFGFEDNRPQAIAQRKLQNIANNSPQTQQLKTVQAMADNSAAAIPQVAQLKPAANNTGLPDNLKSGIENLSGHSMDDVNVHYNSPKPAQLQAHAYAQGTDIHLGAGQEKHLPHEAWHVVQQKQGRVKPTMQMKGTVNVNDDAGLEKEADVMGAKALQCVAAPAQESTSLPKRSNLNIIPVRKGVLQAAWEPDSEHNEQWDELIDGVQWYRDESQRMWFKDRSEEGTYAFWSGQVHSYTSDEWDGIEIENATPAPDTSGAIEKIVGFGDFATYTQLVLSGSRDRPVQLFDANGDPINKKDKSSAAFMIDTGMSHGEAGNYEEVRRMGVRVPKIYGWNAKGAIVQFIPDQVTITAQMATIDKAVAKQIRMLKMIRQWVPEAWQKALVDLNIMIKTGYHAADLQFMVDNAGGHIYVMDLEPGKGARFDSRPDRYLILAKAVIQEALSE